MNTNATQPNVPRGAGRRWLIAAFVGLVLAAPTPALAQEAPIRLGRWDARLELKADFDRDNAEAASGPFSLRSRRLSQRFELRNTGLIVGRRLLVLRGGASILTQQTSAANIVSINAPSGTVERTTTNSVRGRALNYDIGLNVRPSAAYQLDVNASRSNSDVNMEFGTSTVINNDIQTATLRFGKLPMSPAIIARRYHIDRASWSGTRVTRSVETRRALEFTAFERWDLQSLNLSWAFDDLRNDLLPGLSNPTHRAGLVHTVRLPFLANEELRTSVQGFSRGGPRPLKRFNISESLGVQILPSLSTALSYNFNERHVGEQVYVGTGAGINLSHQLYRSLSTTVSVGASRNRMPAGGKKTTYTMAVNLGYRKEIIGGGRFIGRYRRAYRLQNNAFGESELEIVDERHVGRIGAPFTLLEPHVVVGSVLVTDQSQVVVYEENVDYLVEYIGDLAEIIITPEGRIADGQPLLVSYRVLAPAHTRVGHHTQAWSVGLDYGWISPFFERSSAHQDLLAGDDQGLLSPTDSSTVGLKLRLSGGRFRTISSGEYETFRSRSSAYRRLNFNEFFGYQFDNGATISVNLSQSKQIASIPERTTRRALGRVTASWRLLPPLSVNVLANARLWDDSTGRGETYYEAGFGVRFDYGRFLFNSSLRHYWTVRDGLDKRGIRAMLGLTRLF